MKLDQSSPPSVVARVSPPKMQPGGPGPPHQAAFLMACVDRADCGFLRAARLLSRARNSELGYAVGAHFSTGPVTLLPGTALQKSNVGALGVSADQNLETCGRESPSKRARNSRGGVKGARDVRRLAKATRFFHEIFDMVVIDERFDTSAISW